MLGSAPVVAFVPVTDLDRARAFYEGVLGLTVVSADSFACVFRTGAGTMLRATLVGELRPQPFTVLGWYVDDIEGAAKVLAAAGVVSKRFDGMEQDAQRVGHGRRQFQQLQRTRARRALE
jgi:catechol 2,3-dioxygenase-like lactoylglutathione lyase family enzyme